MRTKIGTITSIGMQKTVTVTTHRSVMHPVYEKRFRTTKKFLADTGDFTLGLGDEVVITECRPLSKRKNFRVTEVRKKAPQFTPAETDTSVSDISSLDHRSI